MASKQIKERVEKIIGDELITNYAKTILILQIIDENN